MSFVSRVFSSLSFSLLLIGTALAQSQSSTTAVRSTHSLPSPTEATVNSIVERYFERLAAKDLEGLMRLWSTDSTAAAARKKATAELFASTKSLTLKSLVVRKTNVTNDKARVRV